MKLLIVFFLIFLLTGPAAAEEFQPLELGNFWSYVSDEGAAEMRVVTQMVPIFETETYGIEYTESPNNQGLVNFWTSEPDGGVLLHGFFRETWGMAYQPPIRVVDAPLFVGKTWSSTTDLFVLPDTTYYMTMEFSFTVHEDPELTVPAGAFPTFGIGDPVPGSSAILGGRFTLEGKARAGRDYFVDRWYSLGVGVVQDTLDHLYQLETYTDHPVAVEVSSWGSVKALYRAVE